MHNRTESIPALDGLNSWKNGAHSILGTSLGEAVFTDLDYADDVALLAEMLEILLISLDIMQQEANPFGLEINWNKTKIQHIDNQLSNPALTTSKVEDNDVEIVNTLDVS